MRRYALPLLDQVVVAGFNLVLQLALVRFATASDYGTFILWQALVMVMTSFQDALVGLPLSVRIAYEESNQRRFVLERQVASLATGLIALCASAILVGSTVVMGSSLALALAQTLFAATFLAYFGVRYLAQSRAKFGAALAVDAAYSLASLTMVALLVLADRLTLTPLFLALSLPAVLATIVGLAVLDRPPPVRLRRMLSGYATIWRDSRWTVAAVTASELQTRTFMFVVGAVYGPATLAGIFAGNLILRHLAMLLLAWRSFARPFVVVLRDRGDYAGFVKFCVVSALVLILLNVVNLAVVSVAWPLIETYIYADKYENMLPVVRVWTLINALQVPMTVLAIMLTTLGRYREDSIAVMIGSVATVASVFTFAFAVSAEATLYGAGIGYVVSGTIMAWWVGQELRRRRAQTVAHAA